MNNLQLWSAESSILPASYFIEKGFSPLTAESLYGFQLVLSNIVISNKILVADLKQLRLKKMFLEENGQEIETPPSHYDLEKEFQITIRQSGSIQDLGAEGLVPFDSSLLPLWRQFTDTLLDLSSFKEVPNINITIANVEVHDDVMDLLVPALKSIPLSKVLLHNNRLGKRGVSFLNRLLQENSSISTLYMNKNYMEPNEQNDDIISLTSTIGNHPSLDTVLFRSGCIGKNEKILPLLCPSIFKLNSFSLCKSNLGTHDIKLITNCLATNPPLQSLYLNDIKLDDTDALRMSDSLQANTNLGSLHIGGSLTEISINIMIKSIYDDASLNSLHDSNASCRLRLFRKGDTIPIGVDEGVLNMNVTLSANIDNTPISVLTRCTKDTSSGDKLYLIEGNRRVKILYALFGGNSSLQAQYLNEIPIELMPRVVSYIDEGSKWTGAEDKKLDRLFQLVLSRPDSMVSFARSDQKEEKKEQQGLSLESKIIAVVVAVVSAFVGIITATTIRWYHDS